MTDLLHLTNIGNLYLRATLPVWQPITQGRDAELRASTSCHAPVGDAMVHLSERKEVAFTSPP